jgi:hypothetical protein
MLKTTQKTSTSSFVCITEGVASECKYNCRYYCPGYQHHKTILALLTCKRMRDRSKHLGVWLKSLLSFLLFFALTEFIQFIWYARGIVVSLQKIEKFLPSFEKHGVFLVYNMYFEKQSQTLRQNCSWYHERNASHCPMTPAGVYP